MNSKKTTFMKKNYHLLCSILLYTFFFIYIFLLLSVLFFARIGSERSQFSVNIIPFHTIGSYLSQLNTPHSGFAFTNIFGNIFMFSPLGLYMPILRGNKKMIIYLFWIFIFSLAAEILQFVFGLGALDVDDIILNCLGGLLGLIAYKILFVLFKQEQRVRLFAMISSVIVGVLVLLYFYL